MCKGRISAPPVLWFRLERPVRADCGDERSEDDDEGGDEEVEADAFRAVRFHTHMLHPPLPIVNPHPADVGFLTPWNRRRIVTCAADSAAVDCRTPRIPRSIPHLAVDSAPG